MARWPSVPSAWSVIQCFVPAAMPLTSSIRRSSAWWPTSKRPFPRRVVRAGRHQIGVSRRVFAYNVDGRAGHLVNPVIEAVEGEQEEDEGCLSLPGLWYPVRRAQYARVRGVDRLGQPVVVESEGLLARCIQHEVDRLNGQLFVDRLSGSCGSKQCVTCEKCTSAESF